MTDNLNTGRRWHDMGGENAGPVERAEHDLALWEKRVDAIYTLCAAKGLFTVDGLRRALEDMGPQAFEELSYYDRWVISTAQNLIEAGTITVAELNSRMEEVSARGATYGDAQGRGDPP